MSKVLDDFPKGETFDTERYGMDICSPCVMSGVNGVVGIEVEMEGQRLPRDGFEVKGGLGWTVHTDNSLRNGGLEYVLTEPVAEADVPEFVHALYRRFDTDKLVPSNRTSTHVHLNFGGQKLNGLAAFVALWGAFEDTLINWCADNRIGNLFALRMSDSAFAASTWAQAFQTGSFRFSNDYKYLALNPAALNRFGSLEIRALEGTIDPERIIKWVNLLCTIRSTALGMENPLRIPEAISGNGGFGYLESIIGHLPIFSEIIDANKARGVDNVDKTILKGFRRVQPIIYSLPWDVLVPEMNKVRIPDPFGKKVKKNRLVDFAEAMDRQRPAYQLNGAAPQRAVVFDDPIAFAPPPQPVDVNNEVRDAARRLAEQAEQRRVREEFARVATRLGERGI